MPAASEKTAAVIRARGKARPKKSQKLPRQQQPNLIRVEYFKAIEFVPKTAQRNLMKLLVPALPELLPAEEDRVDSARADASERKRAQQLDQIIKRAAVQTAEAVRPKEIAQIAAKYGKRTSDFQKDQLDAQVRAAFSVSIDKIAITEKGVVDQIEGWIALNTDLIVSLPERYFDDVRSRVLEAIDLGTRHETIAKDLAERYEIPINQAKLIARDQVGKLYGDLNSQRQQNLGVTDYTWRGVNDNREREDHVDREGQKFAWDDPPADGHPGFPVNCRCYAEPDFSAILDEL
jgi:SPP1 gp7 family putative phage head morphogenesis protein